MTRPALSAERAIDILNFLAALPDETFTLSELTKSLGVNVASTHAILGTLTAAGYLVRHPVRRTYELGPALVAVGDAALDRHDVVDQARREAQELSRSLDAEVVVSTVAGDDILTLARAGRARRLETRPRAGQRLPHLPPLGVLSVAWADEAEVEAWIGRMGPQATDADIEACWTAVAHARRMGCEIGLETESRRLIGQLLPELARAPRSEQVRDALRQLVAGMRREEHSLVDVQPRRRYDVNTVSAPVFGATGRVALSMSVLGLPTPMTGRQIDDVATALLERTRRITLTTNGRLPLDLPARA